MPRTVGSTHATPPAAWLPLCDRLAAVLATYPTGGHAISLALAGLLLVDHEVPPEVVPAIVDNATTRANWRSPAPGHYRQNALDTVARWQRHEPIRRDVPPAVLLAVPDVTVTQTPLEEQTRKLEAAIRDAGEGVTVVRAGCGLGKTRAAEHITDERAARTGEHKQNVRTSISVPTNELAEQVTEHLRAAGVPTLRVFGPASVKGPHDGWECRCRDAASALAAGGLSIRWELCEGRGQLPCPYRSECRAVDGTDGPEDARAVVGNAGLLGELADKAGKTGLLVIDEPPSVLDDVILTSAMLDTAAKHLNRFSARFATAMAPALDCVRRWLPTAPLASACHLEDALVDPDPEQLEYASAATGAETAADAVHRAYEHRQRVPPVELPELSIARHSPVYARSLGTAAAVLGSIHRAVTDDSVRAAVYETRSETPTRYLALTGVRTDLAEALRREGRTVVMAADAHLYAKHYHQLLGYEPRYLELRAPDGVAVRRVAIRSRQANRTQWLVRGKRPAGLLEQALRIVTDAWTSPTPPRIAVVTFLALQAWVQERAPHVAVGHYGALRGLDFWREYDALITLGDPLPNLDHVGRTTENDVSDRARALACAELEQAHGRLRTVHRTTPCTQVHVGMLVPDGWRAPIEEVEPTEGGRPVAAAVDLGELAELVKELGGVRAAARAVGKDAANVSRWTHGESVPRVEDLATLREAASAAGTSTSSSVAKTTLIENVFLIDGFRNTSRDDSSEGTEQATEAGAA